MPSIVFTATALQLAKLVAATCANRGYPEFVDDPQNPGTEIPNTKPKAQWAKEYWWSEFKKEVRTFEERDIVKAGTYTDIGTGE